MGEFQPDQIKLLIEVAKDADLYTGEYTGQFVGYQFVTDDENSRYGYLELIFEELPMK